MGWLLKTNSNLSDDVLPPPPTAASAKDNPIDNESNVKEDRHALPAS